MAKKKIEVELVTVTYKRSGKVASHPARGPIYTGVKGETEDMPLVDAERLADKGWVELPEPDDFDEDFNDDDDADEGSDDATDENY